MSYTPTPNKVSTLNGTTTPLGAGATYTGTAEEVTPYDSVVLTVIADQAGFMYADFSPDGTNWDSTLSFEQIAGTAQTHRLTCSRKYFRVRFTNISASLQTYIRLQCVLGGYTTLNSPSLAQVPQDADTLVTKPLQTDLFIAADKFEGLSTVNKFGVNPDVDTGTVPEDLWGGGGIYAGFPVSTVETVDVVSTSANDTSAGTGARTVIISGLDTNYAVQSETITLNGTANVTSANTYRRVHTMYVATAGSGGVNAGDITVKHTTTVADVFLFLRTGYNQTQDSCYTVPAGYTGYLRHVEATMYNAAAAAAATLTLWIRPDGAAQRYRRPFAAATGFSYYSDIYGGLALPEKTDIMVRCLNVTNSNSEVSCGYDLILVKDV